MGDLQFETHGSPTSAIGSDAFCRCVLRVPCCATLGRQISSKCDCAADVGQRLSNGDSSLQQALDVYDNAFDGGRKGLPHRVGLGKHDNEGEQFREGDDTGWSRCGGPRQSCETCVDSDDSPANVRIFGVLGEREQVGTGTSSWKVASTDVELPPATRGGALYRSCRKGLRGSNVSALSPTKGVSSRRIGQSEKKHSIFSSRQPSYNKHDLTGEVHTSRRKFSTVAWHFVSPVPSKEYTCCRAPTKPPSLLWTYRWPTGR